MKCYTKIFWYGCKILPRVNETELEKGERDFICKVLLHKAPSSLNVIDAAKIANCVFFIIFSGGKKQADIVFLLDGSINLGRDNFQEVLQFVYSVVDAIYRDGDSIQVGLAQYNSDVTDEFFLKDHSTKAQILDAINKVIYKGGRVANTGAAIKHIQERHFVKEAGSRIDQRVPQIAFIVTGGKSTDDGPRASQEITQKGVKVFAVGVRNIDLKEVSLLASESAMSFRASTAQELSELNEQVLVTLEAAMEEKLCPGTTDVTRGKDNPFIMFSGCPQGWLLISRVL